MARVAFSIRFPPQLADALAWLSQKLECSPSDLVERILTGVDEPTRDEIIQAAVEGAPTQKRNLRLSTDTLARLKELAGDLEPSEFLRRTIAHVVATAPPEYRQGAAPYEDDQRPTSAGPRERSRLRDADDGDGAGIQAASSAGGLLIVAVLLAIGGLVWFIVWLVFRLSEGPSSGPGSDPPRQLPGGNVGSDAA
jgi:hypothetical protein